MVGCFAQLILLQDETTNWIPFPLGWHLNLRPSRPLDLKYFQCFTKQQQKPKLYHAVFSDCTSHPSRLNPFLHLPNGDPTKTYGLSTWDVYPTGHSKKRFYCAAFVSSVFARRRYHIHRRSARFTHTLRRRVASWRKFTVGVFLFESYLSWRKYLSLFWRISFCENFPGCFLPCGYEA